MLSKYSTTLNNKGKYLLDPDSYKEKTDNCVKIKKYGTQDQFIKAFENLTANTKTKNAAE